MTENPRPNVRLVPDPRADQAEKLWPRDMSVFRKRALPGLGASAGPGFPGNLLTDSDAPGVRVHERVRPPRGGGVVLLV